MSVEVDAPSLDWKVTMSWRTIGGGGSDISERPLGDVVVSAGPDACVGDLVVALASYGGATACDLGWAALLLEDGTVAEADVALS